jgi:hypothetical protein
MPTFVEDNTLLQREYMLQEVEMFPPKDNYLFTKLFKETASPSNIVSWDIKFNNSGLAGHISQGGEPNPVSGRTIGKGREEVSYKKESYLLDSNEIRWRSTPGQAGVSETANQFIQDGKALLIDRLNARVEWECVNALRGSFDFTTSDGVTRTVDYGIPSSNIIDLTDGGGANVWTDISVDIIGMLKTWRGLLRGVGRPTLYVTPTVNNLLMTNTGILALMTAQQKMIMMQNNELGIPIAGVNVVVYEAEYMGAHANAPDDFTVPSATNFMTDEEVFLVGSPLDSAPLYNRVLAGCVEASTDGKTLVPKRFSFLETLRRDRFQVVTGEYSLPIIKNPYSIVHATVSD